MKRHVTMKRMAFKYQHLAKTLRDKVHENWWLPGEQLPSIRSLCHDYQMSLATVRHALEELEAQGYIEARDRTGYFVLPRPTRVNCNKRAFDYTARFQPNSVVQPDLLYDIMQRSAAFDFYPNGPSVSLPHLKILQKLQAKSRKQIGPDAAIKYEEPLGALVLREQLCCHYQLSGLQISPDDIYLTAGCQNALFLALKSICKPGDVVVIEQPAFYGVLQLLQYLELMVIEVPTNEDGYDLIALEHTLEKWQIAACIVTPSFGTPTGHMMPINNKKKLIQLAYQYDFAVIEDDIYGDLGFHERPLPLKALDTDERVVLCSSLSKSLDRDLRMGWIMPGRWHKQIGRLKLISQLAGSQCDATAISHFMAEGHYRRHLRQFRTLLIHHHDQLHRALSELFPRNQNEDVSTVKWTSPYGGLSLWLELPYSIDSIELYNRALHHGLVLTPGPLFTSNQKFKNYLRMPFVNPIAGSRLHALTILHKLITSI
jgi:DNA-binding transcriptional MocR family regulator